MKTQSTIFILTMVITMGCNNVEKQTQQRFANTRWAIIDTNDTNRVEYTELSFSDSN